MREDIQRLSQQVTEAWMTCCQRNVPRKGTKYTCATCGKMIRGADKALLPSERHGYSGHPQRPIQSLEA